MEVTLQVKNVTIIGSGLMGHGIALKFANYNFNVIVYDPNDVSLNSLFERIEISLSQMEIKKEEIKKIISSINKTNNLEQALEKAGSSRWFESSYGHLYRILHGW